MKYFFNIIYSSRIIDICRTESYSLLLERKANNLFNHHKNRTISLTKIAKTKFRNNLIINIADKAGISKCSHLVTNASYLYFVM